MKEEVELWTVAVGNMPGPFSLPGTRRLAKAAIDLIKQQAGFVGVDPQPPHGTLLLFRTENNAKRARNVLRENGVRCGNNVCKVFVDKEFFTKEKERAETSPAPTERRERKA